MTLKITLKGGKGSGWHAPPRGTHSGDKHRAVGSGKATTKKVSAVAGTPKPDAAPKAAPSGESPMEANETLVFAFSEEVSGATWDTASQAHRAALKDSVCAGLASDIVSYEDANAILAGWAETSNDESPEALALQESASHTFGIPMSDFTQGKIDGTGTSGGSITDPEVYDTALATMHANTKALFDEMVYAPSDKITLYRGMLKQFDNPNEFFGLEEGKSIRVSGNPLESWSIDRKVATIFARGAESEEGYAGIVMKMDVPIRDIVATPLTGIGCLDEGEVVVMGSRLGTATIESFDYGFAD